MPDEEKAAADRIRGAAAELTEAIRAGVEHHGFKVNIEKDLAKEGERTGALRPVITKEI